MVSGYFERMYFKLCYKVSTALAAFECYSTSSYSLQRRWTYFFLSINSIFIDARGVRFLPSHILFDVLLFSIIREKN